MDKVRRGGRFGGFRTSLRDERGGAIILAILVSMVVLGAGAVALTVSRGDMRISAYHNRGVLAKYHAESQLQRAVGLQNDLTASPRWLFNPINYTKRAAGPNDTSRMTLQAADAPFGGGTRADGEVLLSIIGKDPVTQSPPYTVRSRAVLADGSSATYQATLDVLSLLDFAVFSDDDIFIAPNITISGRVYSGRVIDLTGPTATFLRRVEYATTLNNPGNGMFMQGHGKVAPLPSLSALVNLNFFESASKASGVCSQGRGIYIGYDGPASVDVQTTSRFRAWQNGALATNQGWGNPANPGCRTGATCYALDMGLFDFSAQPITYGGVPVLGFDGTPIMNFNGIIWADGEIHVWGHLGGRSIEENTVTDANRLITPPFVAANRYSNNLLDAGEDGNNGGAANGRLDPRNRGVSLGVYSDSYAIIDHNLFADTDSLGNPVRMAIVSRNDTRIDGTSPSLIRVEAAVLSVNATWSPQGPHGSHTPNDWANLNGDQPPDAYVYDVDWDGVIEPNNGQPNAGDRDETNVRWAWSLQNLGNLVVATRPNSGHWASGAHPRFYTYDPRLQTAEIPCYPTLPNYGIVPGSFTEVLNAP